MSSRLAEYLATRLRKRLTAWLAEGFATRFIKRLAFTTWLIRELTGRFARWFITPRFAVAEGFATFTTGTGFVTPGTWLTGTAFKVAWLITETTWTIFTWAIAKATWFVIVATWAIIKRTRCTIFTWAVVKRTRTVVE